MRGQSAQFDPGGNGVALLLAELDHRIRNLLTTIEAAVKQTQSASVEDYQAKLMARITGLHSFCEFTRDYGRRIGLAQLLEQSTRPHSAKGAQVLAAGPDVELEPPLALALHLLFHELAANASKFGALSLPLGLVEIQWRVRHVPGAPRKLAIVWVEHGGPQGKHPRHAGFGSRLIKAVLEGFGRVRLDHNSAGLACLMLVDLDRPDAGIEERVGTSCKRGSKLHSHSRRH
jgi:two-component sensor histidine kinase